MDTEAFLLERQKLVEVLEMHRGQALETSTARKKSFLGLPWSDWSHLVLSMGQRSGLATWLPRILLTTVVPLVIASVERKVEGALRRKSGLSRLLEFLPLSRFGL